jgi:hypothetical protein
MDVCEEFPFPRPRGFKPVDRDVLEFPIAATAPFAAGVTRHRHQF